MRIVLNKCYGGFSLSKKACKELGMSEDDCPGRDVLRNDPKLIEIIEKLGKKADGDYAELRIVEIPDDVEWEIEEYDGMEWVAEKHRTWG